MTRKTRKDIVKIVARRTGLAHKDVRRVIEEFEASILYELENDISVTLTGFGTFKVTPRKKKKGRNPITNETMIHPEHDAPVFRFSDCVKDLYRTIEED